MFTIYYTNFGYGPGIDYTTKDEALAAVKKACFESQIYKVGELYGTWSPIGGYRAVSQEAVAEQHPPIRF